MSADGKIVREALAMRRAQGARWDTGTGAHPLAALARLEAAEEERDDLATRLLVAERIEAQRDALAEALQQASDKLPDPMHPAFPRRFVDAQVDALAIISGALAVTGLA